MLIDRLRLYKNYCTNDTKTIKLDGKEYLVNVQGTGNIPVLGIGLSTLMQYTLSPTFKELSSFFSTDLYWVKKDRLNNPTRLTIKKIVDDIFAIIEQLNFTEVVLLAHSAYGIIALEAAKENDPRIKGIIMIGSPTEVSDHIANFNNEYFELHASEARKENDKIRKIEYSKIRKPNDSEVSLNGYESQTARYWGDYTINRGFLEVLWEGIEIDEDIINHFFNTLLPSHSTAKNIEKIKAPVVLFGGRNDYDCLPLELWKNYPTPKNFTVVDCGEAGHWPHFETPQLFDKFMEKWFKIII